jgi:hypothetical protein
MSADIETLSEAEAEAELEEELRSLAAARQFEKRSP